MLGNILWYLAARALGIQRLEPIIRRWGRWITMSWAEVKQAERWFALHGTFFVFLGRLLPTVRSLVSIPAGLLKMSFRRFMLASTLGTAAWTALLAGAGWLHLSGIIPALGPEMAKVGLAATAAARDAGVRVSFDGNFRAALWARWCTDPGPVLADYVGGADLLFGNGRDLSLVLGEALPKPEIILI